jgi:hypothetical protein
MLHDTIGDNSIPADIFHGDNVGARGILSRWIMSWPGIYSLTWIILRESRQYRQGISGNIGVNLGVPGRALACRSCVRSPRKQLFFFRNCATLVAMFRDLPITARELKATPEVLERVYEAARLGLRGESLALAAGMLPQEYARLKLMDRVAEIAEMKGRADSEMAMSRVVFDAAEAGDSKAALEFLKHRHDWVAKQQVQVDVSQQISITAALEQAQKRVEMIEEVVDISAQPKVVIEPKVIPLARELGEEV